MGFKGLLEKVGVLEPETSSLGAPSPVASPVPFPTAASSFQASPPIGNADSEIVEKLKASVLGSSGIMKKYMGNVAVARKQFPNNEATCMIAALAFSDVDKTTLLGELEHTVKAALLQANQGMKQQRQATRNEKVGSLEQQLATANDEVSRMEAQIVDLQQKIAQKRAAIGGLQQQVSSAEADLKKQDSVVDASFAAVEQYIASLKQTINQLSV